ncbi:MAG: Ca-activated chloride channel [Actinomycetota bacterium]|nr:Ca-activated chloride channel [Actinomycetota bacterium]MEA2581404.1 Ca-activated chloride channel [Actinomycetota bacterium]
MTNPLILIVLLIAVVLAAAYFFVNARERKPEQKTGRRFRATYRSQRRPFLERAAPVVLLVASVAFLAIAFTQFRLSRNTTTGTVILVMDTSESMDQTDVAPTRLDAAKAAADAFLQALPADFRVGLVTFAGSPDLAVAPTLERDRVTSALAGLTTDQGTVIGDGLTSALDAMETTWRTSDKGPAAILLLSDGLDTGSTVSPATASSRARALGVPVFTVALGVETASGGADTSLLRQMATDTGGQTFTAQTASQLTSVYSSLGSTLSVDLAIGHSAGLFVGLAALFGLAAGAVLLVSTRRQKF